MHAKPVLALVASAILAANGGPSGGHWSYSGPDGPSHWGGLCASGKHQSPIDIHTKDVKVRDLPPLAFNYHASPLHIVDNGHSVQVDVAKGSSTLSVGGVRFPLVQFHFHKSSEEEVDGRHYAMVIHLVHRDSEGNLAVVAVPLEAGAANPLIGTLWAHLPHEKEHEEEPVGVTIDPSALLPASRGYFTYVGSLTTPPCTEGVRWFVLKSPLSLSEGQIATFARLYPADARPVQPLNGREVLSSR